MTRDWSEKRKWRSEKRTVAGMVMPFSPAPVRGAPDAHTPPQADYNHNTFRIAGQILGSRDGVTTLIGLHFGQTLEVSTKKVNHS